jgi:hypothetical protein
MNPKILFSAASSPERAGPATWIWRAVLGLAGLAVLGVMLLLGLAVTLVLVVRALLLGRRPVFMRFRWASPRGTAGRAGKGFRNGAARAPQSVEVIDVTSREVGGSDRSR